jgi:glycosyltransferase family protein
LEDLADFSRDFWINDSAWMHSAQSRYLRPGKIYAAAEVTLAYQIYRRYDVEAYFQKFRKIWEGKEIVLIHGDGIFDSFIHDIFDNAKSVEHILAPSRDAFDKYDEILARALQESKDRLMIAILGPAATVLAYDLFRAGYRALDLGHIAKSYDWWRKSRKGDELEFFAPD